MAPRDLLADFKTSKVSRGYTYHYYFAPPASDSGLPTLLFAHGFPGHGLDWHHQISFFKEKGFGIVAPDMLGYGGTDKPEDQKEYLHSLLAKDLVDILENEKVEKAVAIGHDWGSKTTSVLANLFSERFIGFAFLALGYSVPNTQLTYEQLNAMIIQTLGFEVIGYWAFLASPEAPEIIQKHLDSFIDIVYANDLSPWRTHFGPKGAAQATLEKDTRFPRASWFDADLARIYQDNFQKNGLRGPTNYYRVAIDNDIEDAKQIPLEKYAIAKPVFVGVGFNDMGLEGVAPAMQKANSGRFCSELTFKEYAGVGHWVQMEAPEQVNADLEAWIKSVTA